MKRFKKGNKYMELLKTNNSILICGDTIVEMKKMIEQGNKIDKVITSPPYNIVRSID